LEEQDFAKAAEAQGNLTRLGVQVRFLKLPAPRPTADPKGGAMPRKPSSGSIRPDRPTGTDSLAGAEPLFEFVIDNDAPPEDGLSALATILLKRVLARREAARQGKLAPTAVCSTAKLRRHRRRSSKRNKKGRPHEQQGRPRETGSYQNDKRAI
jgi:hypothetical protein